MSRILGMSMNVMGRGVERMMRRRRRMRSIRLRGRSRVLLLLRGMGRCFDFLMRFGWENCRRVSGFLDFGSFFLSFLSFVFVLRLIPNLLLLFFCTYDHCNFRTEMRNGACCSFVSTRRFPQLRFRKKSLRTERVMAFKLSLSSLQRHVTFAKVLQGAPRLLAGKFLARSYSRLYAGR